MEQTRPPSSLPPINPNPTSKHNDTDLAAAATIASINHTQSNYAYQPATTVASAPTSATTLKTSDSHRSSATDYDLHPSSAPACTTASAPAKQSLPPIHEALRNQHEEHASQRPRSPDPRYGTYRRRSSPSPVRYPRPRQYWQSPPSPRSYGPVSAHTTSPRPQEAWAPPSSTTATVSARSQVSPRGTPGYAPSTQSPNFAGHGYVYSHPPPQYARAQGYPSNYHPPQTYSHDNPGWADQGPDNKRKHGREIDDLEEDLRQVRDCSWNLLQFADHFRQRSHDTQRSGPVSGSMPSIGDVHAAMGFNHQIQERLDYILKRVRTEEAERAEQLAREARETRPPARTEPAHEVQTTSPTVARVKETDGFAGGEAKKRRGRAAPPGRCHACNRAETPEWRRGPDGARTLCNACGLHYAKHARKHGSHKAAVVTSGGALRPKEGAR